MKRYINDAPNAPKAVGPYAQAVVVNKTAYLSGQIPISPETGEMVSGGIEEQTKQVLKNLAAVLKSIDCDFSNVVQSTIYLIDLKNDYQTVNRIYEESLNGAKPARATIQVAALPKGSLVEIAMIAVEG